MATYGIIGSRDYHNEQAVRLFVRCLPAGSTVVSGGRSKTYQNGKQFIGRGVDVWAADEAEACGLVVVEYYPDMDALPSPRCFHVRNKQIADHVANADDGVAVYGWSRIPVTSGTRSGLAFALEAGTSAIVINAEGTGPLITTLFSEVR